MIGSTFLVMWLRTRSSSSRSPSSSSSSNPRKSDPGESSRFMSAPSLPRVVRGATSPAAAPFGAGAFPDVVRFTPDAPDVGQRVHRLGVSGYKGGLRKAHEWRLDAG